MMIKILRSYIAAIHDPVYRSELRDAELWPHQVAGTRSIAELETLDYQRKKEVIELVRAELELVNDETVVVLSVMPPSLLFPRTHMIYDVVGRYIGPTLTVDIRLPARISEGLLQSIPLAQVSEKDTYNVLRGLRQLAQRRR